jgi:SAM-dependent methyltransferase
MHLVHRTSCRICGSTALTKVINLGEQHLQGSFVKPAKELPPMRKIPCVLVRCDPTIDEKACGLLQLAHTVPPEILYSAYWYRSGTNQTMRMHLKEIADQTVSFIRKNEALVLDIGCNDGTLLKCYPAAYEKIGIDPSDIAGEITEDITIIQDLFPCTRLLDWMGERKFDIVSSIAMFYDLEDPIAFVSSIKQVLDKEGLWVFEMSYMPTMLEQNAYDTICHEHLEYYSLAVIEYILRKTDMKLIHASLNSSNGGSIRCYATHDSNFRFDDKAAQQALANLRLHEFDLALDTDEPYKNFQERIEKHRDELKVLLKKLKRAGKKIHVYGASTKGNTLLQWCDIDHTIVDCAAERNAEKFGARTIGTDISIVSEEESRALKPDYYLVLPWHFKEEFLEREKDMIVGGTGMIFPLPTIEIVTNV